jgi:hypothetical protein
VALAATECGEPGCPAAAILSAAPPSGVVDARQPHSVSGPLPRQGIGSPEEPITITLSASGAADCFTLCETLVDPLLGPNAIVSAVELSPGTYRLVLHHAISAGGVTTIGYAAGSDVVRYIAHPANTNADSASTPLDILFLINCLNGVQTPPHGLYSLDIDHGGLPGPTDILRTIDLINGAGAFDPWNNTPQPAPLPCP